MGIHSPVEGRKRGKLILTDQIVRWYTQDHLTLRQIAALTHLSFNAVYKRLKKADIVAYDGEHVKLHCTFCNEVIDRHRSRARTVKEPFCNKTCYFLHLHNPNFLGSRTGLLTARKVAKIFFPSLTPKNIVHHWNSDQTCNLPRNLAVFVSNSAHMAWHRRGALHGLLWDGRQLPDVAIQCFVAADPVLAARVGLT